MILSIEKVVHEESYINVDEAIEFLCRIHGRQVRRREKIIVCWDPVEHGKSRPVPHNIVSIALDECSHRPMPIYDSKVPYKAPKKNIEEFMTNIVDAIIGFSVVLFVLDFVYFKLYCFFKQFIVILFY